MMYFISTARSEEKHSGFQQHNGLILKKLENTGMKEFLKVLMIQGTERTLG